MGVTHAGIAPPAIFAAAITLRGKGLISLSDVGAFSTMNTPGLLIAANLRMRNTSASCVRYLLVRGSLDSVSTVLRRQNGPDQYFLPLQLLSPRAVLTRDGSCIAGTGTFWLFVAIFDGGQQPPAAARRRFIYP